MVSTLYRRHQPCAELSSGRVGFISDDLANLRIAELDAVVERTDEDQREGLAEERTVRRSTAKPRLQKSTCHSHRR